MQLNQHILDLVNELWPQISERILQINPRMLISDANYLVTGVCVYTLSHHFSMAEADEFARGPALDNFNAWYKLAIEDSIKARLLTDAAKDGDQT